MKSGTLDTENGVTSEAEICGGREVGSVQATIAVIRAEKSFGVLVEMGATGSGCELGADDDKQHDLPQEQQPRLDAGLAGLLGTDATA